MTKPSFRVATNTDDAEQDLDKARATLLSTLGTVDWLIGSYPCRLETGSNLRVAIANTFRELVLD